MSSVNKMILVGRLGDDPVLRSTPSGKFVANFSVATQNKAGAASEGYGKEVEWHRIVVWDKLAENCKQFLAKGRMVYVEGRLQTRQYDKDGQKHYATEIIANNIQFLSPKDEGQAPKPAAKVPTTPEGNPDWDSIPF